MAYQQQPSAWGGGYSSPLSSGAPPAYSSSGQQTFSQQNYQPFSQPQSTSSQQQQGTSRTNPTTAAAQPPQQTNYGSSSANYYNNNLPSSPYYNQQQPSQQQGQPAQYGQVASWYQQILGRVPSYAEVQQQLHNFTPEGLSTQNMQAVLSGIQNSPEAQRYAQQHPGPPATTMPMPYQGGPGGPPVPGAQQWPNGMWQGPDGTLYTPQGQPVPDTGPGGIAGPGRTAPNPAWDTNGYAAPGYVANPASRYALPGFDAAKWNDPTLQDPKYVVGRILSNFPQNIGGLQQAMPQIAKAYPGSKQTGEDTVWLPGVGNIDVVKAGGGFWWGPETDANGNPYPQAAAAQSPQMDPTMQALQMISQQMQMPPGYAMPAAQPAAQQSSGPDNAAIQSQIAQLMSYFQQQQQQQDAAARAASLAARTPNVSYY